jgi:hypothetical protein
MSTSSIGEERFFRKPDFQLRDVGAPSPAVSFSQNVSLACSTQPVIVTVDSVSVVALGAGLGEGAVGTGCGTGFVAFASASDTDEVTSVIGSFEGVSVAELAGAMTVVRFAGAAAYDLTAGSALGGMPSVHADVCRDASGAAADATDFRAAFVSAAGSMRAMSWSGDGRRAAITTAAAMTHTSPSARTSGWPVQPAGVVPLARRWRLAPAGRDRFLAFFARLDSLLNEIVRIARSAESRY